MATLIPAIGSSAFDSTGERRLAERLEQKLDADYLLWHNVPIGPKQTHPDFVVLHARRGLLVLETKDWRLQTVQDATRQAWTILDNGRPKVVINPLAQARHCAIQVVNALERDPQLVQTEGPHKGKLAFPWGHGVVFTRITRKEFESSGLAETIDPHYVICQDEMLEHADPEEFQQRLWNMFAHRFGSAITLPQLDRVRWIMFPQVRVQTQGALFDDNDADAQLPDIMRVMDLQQEQLARSLGDGHRVIHGVAGSGKTMILGYRAEYLAKACTPASKPILILCFNEPLGVKLASVMDAKGLSDRVHVRHFHSWCHRQLTTYGQALPPQGGGFFEGLVDHLIRAVERSQVPGGQYQAVMIDEGHDFAPEWLKLVTQMVDPATNSLLVLYDDAQSIYERARSKQFSFKSVGIQAQGRTTILKINYRNTRQILHTASLVAADLLTADDKDDDGIPLLKPVSCGREGQAPVIIKLPTLRDEAFAIADHLASAHKEGHAWGDMAVLCADWKTMDLCASALAQRKLPHRVRKKSGEYRPGADAIQVMTMKVSKGLEFPVVALPGVGHMPAPGEDEKEAARVFYVAATRATQRLVMGVGGDGGLGSDWGNSTDQSFRKYKREPMRIKSVRIKNLRSFVDQKVEFNRYNRLVGANGAGKSTVLCALNIFFRETQNAATDLTALQAEDFHVKNVADPIEITVEFSDLGAEAQADFAEYFRQDVLVISAIAQFDPASGSAVVKQYGQRLAMPILAPYFKAANDGVSAIELKAIYAGLRTSCPDLPAAGTKDAMAAALHAYEAARPAECALIPSEDQFYGVSKGSNRLAKYVQWVYVPAVKDAADEQAELKNTALGRLLARAVRSKVNFSDKIKLIATNAQEEYKKLLQENQGALNEISASLATRIAQWAHPDAALRVEWRQDPKKSVQVEEPLAAVLASEGAFEGQLSRFGHGLQRSFLLALLQELAESGDQGPALILGCEEPELYQHPPQARHLSSVLLRLSEQHAQILITTHSPYFVSGDAFEDVRVVRRVPGAQHSVICSYNYDQFATAFAHAKGAAPLKANGALAKVHQVLQPALNEMFFAQRLALVEGLEDVAYIHSWLVASGRWDEFRRRGVHIVPANGKSSLLQPLIIAKGLGIPTLLIFDADGGDEKHQAAHQRDNTALLRIVGGNDAEPFPVADVFAENHIVWANEMGAAVKAGVSEVAWTDSANYGSVQCGMAGDLAKNALYIGARLSWLWENGHRPESLDQVCNAVVTFA